MAHMEEELSHLCHGNAGVACEGAAGEGGVGASVGCNHDAVPLCHCDKVLRWDAKRQSLGNDSHSKRDDDDYQ